MKQKTANSTFIELSNLSRSFAEGEHRHWVLKEVSLNFNRGETVALLGRSGSGKSTLLNIISGIDIPDAGQVRVENQSLTEFSEHDRTLYRREHIGFIYQFFNLVPSLSAGENVEFILELNGYSKTEMNKRTEDILQQLDMTSKAHLFPSQLSGGEQQRIAIARALVHSPKIVLADEPTGNLDAKTGKKILTVLKQQLKKNNSAMLLVTHSLEVAKTADRIVTLEEGVLREQESDFAW